MITLFTIMLIAVVFELIVFAVKAAWGITKIVFTVLFFPLILVGLVAAGLLYLALPILIVVGIITFIGGLVA